MSQSSSFFRGVILAAADFYVPSFGSVYDALIKHIERYAINIPMNVKHAKDISNCMKSSYRNHRGDSFLIQLIIMHPLFHSSLVICPSLYHPHSSIHPIPPTHTHASDRPDAMVVDAYTFGGIAAAHRFDVPLIVNAPSALLQFERDSHLTPGMASGVCIDIDMRRMMNRTILDGDF